MVRIEEIVSSIEALSDTEFVNLRQWFSERDQEKWDHQIQVDSDSANLDFLVEEANQAKAKGQLKPL